MSDMPITRRTVLRGAALGTLGTAALPAAEALTQTPARAATSAAAPTALTVDTANPGHAVSPQLYGAFFEEINYAGVGGLYAELLRNRAFMDPSFKTLCTCPDLEHIRRTSGQSPVFLIHLSFPRGAIRGYLDWSRSRVMPFQGPRMGTWRKGSRGMPDCHLPVRARRAVR
jgi:hypothetical protein